MRTAVHAILNFGALYVPVGVAKTAGRVETNFKHLHVDCATPVSQRYVCKECDMSQSLEPDEIVKGFEVTKGTFVVIDKDELEAFTVTRSKMIGLNKFVPYDDLDRLMVEKTYFLIPHAILRKPYEILSSALSDTGFVGIGKATLWGKEYPVAVDSEQGILMLHMLFCHDEIVKGDEITATLQWDVTDEELDLTKQFIQIKSGSLDMKDLTSETREATHTYLMEKASGAVLTPPEEEPEPDVTTDAVAALKASILAATK